MTGKTIVIDLYLVGYLVGFVVGFVLVATLAAGHWSYQHTVINAELPTLQSDGSKLTPMDIKAKPGACLKWFGYEEKVIRYETTRFPSGWKSTDPEHDNLSKKELSGFYHTWLLEEKLLKAVTAQPTTDTTTIVQAEGVQPEVTPIETPPTILEEARLLEKTLQEIFHLQAWVHVRQARRDSLGHFMVIYHRDTPFRLGDPGYLDRWCDKMVLYRWAPNSEQEQDF